MSFQTVMIEHWDFSSSCLLVAFTFLRLLRWQFLSVASGKWIIIIKDSVLVLVFFCIWLEEMLFIAIITTTCQILLVFLHWVKGIPFIYQKICLQWFQRLSLTYTFHNCELTASTNTDRHLKAHSHIACHARTWPEQVQPASQGFAIVLGLWQQIITSRAAWLWNVSFASNISHAFCFPSGSLSGSAKLPQFWRKLQLMQLIALMTLQGEYEKPILSCATLLSSLPHSENYLVKWSSSGLVKDIDQLHNLRSVFTVSVSACMCVTVFV